MIPNIDSKNGELDEITTEYVLPNGNSVTVYLDEEAKQALLSLIQAEIIKELKVINAINEKLGDDYSELDAQQDIEIYVEQRLIELNKLKGGKK